MLSHEKLNWFREHLINEILPRWLAHSRTENGLFFTNLGRKWERLQRDDCSLVSQTRLLYNFSVGYQLTGQAEYLEAVNDGANALLRYFRDSEHGGWWWSCDMKGETLDPHKDLYGHAFAILCLTHAATATDREDLKRAAMNTWEVVDSHFRDASGGFVWRLTPDFSSMSDTRSQNPVMHLFEALFVLHTIDDSGRIRRAGQEVAEFVLDRLIRKGDGILPEMYSEDWGELSEEDNGRIDVGHQFEWAYLLSRAAEAGWSQDYLKPAQKLLENGLALGFDETDGGIMSPAAPDGTIRKPIKGWWEQCEAIRALLHFGVVRQYEEAWKPLEKVIAFAQEHFVDEEHGGWFMSPSIAAGEDRISLNKGSGWKADYHVVSMCAEAIRLEKSG
ncbi:AGE family epimerase/isomerase [Candidatus Poribacteria bacterium]